MRVAVRIGALHSLAVVAVLTLVVSACVDDSFHLEAESAATPTVAAAATPEEAVRAAVERDGAVYAGACAATRSPQDIGKVCASLIGEKGDMRAYLTGRTFSEYSLWLFLKQTSAGWSAVATSPLDFFSQSEEIPWP